MMQRLSRLVVPAALAALVAAAPLAAQDAPRAVSVPFGRATVSVLAVQSGWVRVDVVRNSSRVTRWFAPAAVDDWTTEASKLLAAPTVRLAGAGSAAPSVERAEFRSPWLAAHQAGAMMLDRVEKDGRSELHLFISELGVNAESIGDGRNLYVDGDAASVGTFLQALEDASARCRAMAAATPSAQPKGRPAGL
jgi:hypothetical protein